MGGGTRRRRARILAVQPRALRVGTAADVTIVGIGLGAKSAAVSFGDGTVVSIVERDEHTIRAHVKVVADAQAGLRTVSVGSVAAGSGTGRAGADTLAVYRQIDQVEVVPGYAIARIGGGRVAPVSAQFEAHGLHAAAGRRDAVLGSGGGRVERRALRRGGEAHRG